ncbi:MAG TPA: zincin-like metallopeptidase domain-containing protein [Polyangia bacterium]|nr:zincin-like metallopeptidase domain-containing protein [Polyangia bacterium]
MNSGVLSKPRIDIHRAVTEKIVAAIEAGAGEFVMPWHRMGPRIGRPMNAATGNRYRGVNVVALWAEATLVGFGSGHWASYLQWQGLGAQVRQGERSSTVVFYREIEPEDPPALFSVEESGPAKRFVVRASPVFNSEQVDGWRPPGQPDVTNPVETLGRVDRLVVGTEASIRHGGTLACYRQELDRIDLPERGLFVGTSTITPTESYYATLLHELVHWTGAKHRLDRTFGSRFGDAAYAAEELVAEIGAAFLCADLNVSNEPRQDHAAYLSYWLQILKSDTKAIFTAARLATQASDYLFERAVPELEPAI